MGRDPFAAPLWREVQMLEVINGMREVTLGRIFILCLAYRGVCW